MLSKDELVDQFGEVGSDYASGKVGFTYLEGGIRIFEARDRKS